MLRRVVIGAAMACLMAGSAYAVDEPVETAPAEAAPVENTECTEQLTKAEEVVHDKIESNALSEADAEKINELLDEADALCTEGKVQDASVALDTVSKLVAKAKQ